MIIRTQDTPEFINKYLHLLEMGEVLPLAISGASMTPFLAPARDVVWLKTPGTPPEIGDIVLYQRKSGRFILHRVHAVDKDTYTMVGDAHRVLEHGIPREKIFAVVVCAHRKGKLLQPGSFWWDFFSKIWIRIVPLRGVCMKTYVAFKKVFG